MAKIFSNSADFSPRRKTSRSPKLRLVAPSATRTAKDPRVKAVGKKDRPHSDAHTRVRAIEYFYL
ncbi:MAG TPA: hypothetical protein VFP59_10000 [Candidatus Angelobacter sp.]|nr:hypothetical protein [Candidatus Angelobacter sp.]